MIEYQYPYRGSVPCTTVGSEDLQRARRGCPGKPSARAGAGTAGDHANYQLYAGRGWDLAPEASPREGTAEHDCTAQLCTAS